MTMTDIVRRSHARSSGLAEITTPSVRAEGCRYRVLPVGAELEEIPFVVRGTFPAPHTRLAAGRARGMRTRDRGGGGDRTGTRGRRCHSDVDHLERARLGSRPRA